MYLKPQHCPYFPKSTNYATMAWWNGYYVTDWHLYILVNTMWIYFRLLADDILLDCSSCSHLWPPSHWLINYSFPPPAAAIDSITVQGPMWRSLPRRPFPLPSFRNSQFISYINYSMKESPQHEEKDFRISESLSLGEGTCKNWTREAVGYSM